uniref:Ig-like domain-containing protein n=1 Tax=Sparus aurata TaxID=8175 RepID=A0A671XF77_SPAAU
MFYVTFLKTKTTNHNHSTNNLSCPAGLTDLIRTQTTVTAAAGEEAGFRCELLQSKDVVQVTWQKVLPDREETLAIYTTKYGQKVNPAFKDKVGFTDAGLQNSSIFIRNVTEEDEGCYLCLFYIDPRDDLKATTCLQLYGKVKSFLLESGSEETVVSCSATGRPAPTVTLTVLRDNVHFPGNSSVSVNNTNGTVTVTSTNDDNFKLMSSVYLTGFQEDSGSEITWFTIITILSVVLFFCCVAAVITVLLIRRHMNR